MKYEKLDSAHETVLLFFKKRWKKIQASEATKNLYQVKHETEEL